MARSKTARAADEEADGAQDPETGLRVAHVEHGFTLWEHVRVTQDMEADKELRLPQRACAAFTL